MQIYIDDGNKETEIISELKLDATAVALGQFDALHIGHTEIIRKVIKYARENGLCSMVYMFANDPREVVLGGNARYINTLEKRFEILEELGVDIVVARRFDKDFMDISYEDFVEKYIVDMFRAKLVAVGYNYRFGKDGRGTAENLKTKCSQFGIEVCAISEVRLMDEQVSSTRIREKISNGEIELANDMMGRAYSISGIIKKGNNIGRSIGFPTANMDLPSDRVIPKFGVYETCAILEGKRYPAISNVGGKPTVDDTVCIETNIIGEFDDLYGKELEVEFYRFMRDIKKFGNLDELSVQLEKDKNKLIYKEEW